MKMRGLITGDEPKWSVADADVKNLVAVFEIDGCGSMFVHIDQTGDIYLAHAPSTESLASDMSMVHLGSCGPDGFAFNSIEPINPFDRLAQVLTLVPPLEEA